MPGVVSVYGFNPLTNISVWENLYLWSPEPNGAGSCVSSACTSGQAGDLWYRVPVGMPPTSTPDFTTGRPFHWNSSSIVVSLLIFWATLVSPWVSVPACKEPLGGWSCSKVVHNPLSLWDSHWKCVNGTQPP